MNLRAPHQRDGQPCLLHLDVVSSVGWVLLHRCVCSRHQRDDQPCLLHLDVVSSVGWVPLHRCVCSPHQRDDQPCLLHLDVVSSVGWVPLHRSVCSRRTSHAPALFPLPSLQVRAPAAVVSAAARRAAVGPAHGDNDSCMLICCMLSAPPLHVVYSTCAWHLFGCGGCRRAWSEGGGRRSQVVAGRCSGSSWRREGGAVGPIQEGGRRTAGSRGGAESAKCLVCQKREPAAAV